MTAPAPDPARRLRSTGFAAAAVGLAVGAHTTAGGAVPVLPLLVLLGTLVEASATAFARRRRGAAATGAALITTQAALHAAFLATEPGHGAHAALGPSMLLAHGLAALVLGWLLSHGETVLVRALARLLPVLAVVPFRPATVIHVLVRTPAGPQWRRPAVSLHDLSRRGPPGRHAAPRA